jgi:hypothetical protein
MDHSPSYGRQRSSSDRLGFAIMLKYFQYHGRFPAALKEIPFDVLKFIADQIKTSRTDIDHFDWFSRTAKRHRTEILSYLGIQRMSPDQ